MKNVKGWSAHGIRASLSGHPGIKSHPGFLQTRCIRASWQPGSWLQDPGPGSQIQGAGSRIPDPGSSISRIHMNPRNSRSTLVSGQFCYYMLARSQSDSQHTMRRHMRTHRIEHSMSDLAFHRAIAPSAASLSNRRCHAAHSGQGARTTSVVCRHVCVSST